MSLGSHTQPREILRPALYLCRSSSLVEYAGFVCSRPCASTLASSKVTADKDNVGPIIVAVKISSSNIQKFFFIYPVKSQFDYNRIEYD